MKPIHVGLHHTGVLPAHRRPTRNNEVTMLCTCFLAMSLATLLCLAVQYISFLGPIWLTVSRLDLES